jgi:SAM-dependent methyltransferase
MPVTAPTHYPFKSSPYSSHSILLARLPEPGRGLRVLDVGCGNGYLAERLAGRGYAVTGIEQPEGVSREFPGSVRFIAADLEGELPDVGMQDIIVCADILEHLRDPAALLKRLRSHLSPGGHFLCSLPNSGNIHFRLTVLSGRFPKEDKGLFDRTHVQFLTWDGWRAMFGDAGLAITTVEPTAIPVGQRYPSIESTLPIRAAEAVCYHMARVYKELFGYQFVVEAR